MDGIAVYSRTINVPTELHINETFDANPGYWKLKQKSNNVVGEINSHIFI